MLKINIPDAAFEAGGVFEGEDEVKTTCVLGIPNENGPLLVVKNSPAVQLEDWNFRPGNAQDYVLVLTHIEKGMVAIEKDSVALSPTEAITLFRTYWQEL